MSKAVLISIRPKWCELIASGKKTTEVRKTAPKIETPFKCYIYCTKETGNSGQSTRFYEHEDGTFYSGGKNFKAFLTGAVVGEFVCDQVESTNCFSGWVCPEKDNIIKRFLDGSCLSEQEIVEYADGRAVCGWRISALKMYDEPKQLKEFEVFRTKHITEKAFFQEGVCDEIRHVRVLEPLSRPPQSWCYVEELQ